MSFCASCGAELQPNAAFCSACGAAVTAAPAAAAAPEPAPEPAPAQLAAVPRAAVAVTDVKTWAMWAHLSALGGLVFPFGNILGPLVIWLSKRDEIPEVNVNGKEALNFQMTMSGISIAIWIVSVALTIASIALPQGAESAMAALIGVIEGLSMLAVLAIWITCVTQASVAAHKGEAYTYRFSLHFIK
jgi:uncharacterized Tic20 family protein